MIYLYTENLFFLKKVKQLVKRILGRDNRGPDAVVAGLLRGLDDLHVPYLVNKKLSSSVEVACVLTGADTLRWAIEEKRKGHFKKIIAGPIIAVVPSEANKIILSPEIDAFVVPSVWVKSWWSALHSNLEHKIKLWASGVKDMGDMRKVDGQVLVFKKNVPDKLFNYVIGVLKSKNLSIEVLQYGSFKPKDYFHALSKSKFMVYLTESESQGIAQQEAWMANIPTLVWNRGYLTYKNYRWDDAKISSPFLSQESGMFFSGQDDFKNILESFLLNYNSFNARKYALENFSDTVSAKKYLDYINNQLCK